MDVCLKYFGQIRGSVAVSISAFVQVPAAELLLARTAGQSTLAPRKFTLKTDTLTEWARKSPPERPGFESRWRKALLQLHKKKPKPSKQSSSSIRPKRSIAIQTERGHIDGENALGFEPTPLRNGALSHQARCLHRLSHCCIDRRREKTHAENEL